METVSGHHKEHLVPQKATVFRASPSTSRQWGLLQHGGHETRRAALAANAAKGCGHLRVAYTQTATASQGQHLLSQALTRYLAR